MSSRVVIPVLDGLEQNDKPLVKKVVKGVRQVSQQVINADSFGSSSCSFSFQPPSQNTVIDRRMELSVPIRILRNDANGGTKAIDKAGNASSGTDDSLKNVFFHQNNSKITVKTIATGAPPTVAETNCGLQAQLGNNLAPRQFPLAHLMDTIDLTINGTHFTSSVNQYIHAVMKYTTPEYRAKVFGSNGYHAPDMGDYEQGMGFNDSPLNKRGEGRRNGVEASRGDLFERVAVIGTKAQANDSMTATITEPLFLSPLMMEFGHGMTNVNDVSVTINWRSALNLAMSYFVPPAANLTARTNPWAIGDFGLEFPSAPTLSVRYYTAQSDVKIPNEIVLPYKQPKIVAQAAATIGSSATHTFTGNNIRLNQIPEACYIYAMRKRSTLAINKPNDFTKPEKVEIQWGNQSGLLSGLTSQNLLALAIQNGCDVSASEANLNGYSLKLEFGKDIPLDDNESPGTRGDYNWQCNYTSKNEGTAGDWEYFQVFIYNGHAVVSPNECRVQTGLLDLKDNVEASDMGHSHGGSIVGGSEVGGSLLGDVGKHLLKKVAGKSKVGKAVAEMVPCAEKAFEAYKTRA